MEAEFARKVEVIESILDAYKHQNASTMVEHVTDDVEWRPLMTAAEGHAFVGPEGVRRWFNELMETFDQVLASDGGVDIEDLQNVGVGRSRPPRGSSETRGRRNTPFHDR